MARLRMEGALREAPEALLRDLEAVDPAAALVYAGPRRWVLGRVVPNEPRRAMAARVLASYAKATVPTWASADEKRAAALRLEESRRFARLALQGFAVIAEYPLNDPDSRILFDFQLRDFLYRFAADLEFAKGLAASEGEPSRQRAIATILDAATTHGVDAWRYAMRKRRVFQGAA